MEPKKQFYKNQAQTIIKNMEKRNITGMYFETKEEALKAILEMMPEGSAISNGGSMTNEEIGLMDAVRNGNYHFIDRTAFSNKEEEKKVKAEIFTCDYFLMSTNAITLDGELINIDGAGSRLSYLIYGPEHVFVIAGMNKVVSDVESGYKRIKDIASPANTVRLNKSTPCAINGRCGDCFMDGCICSHTVVTRRSGQIIRISYRGGTWILISSLLMYHVC